MDIALLRSEVEHMQRAARIMIVGETRTPPTKVLEMFLDLPTLGTAMVSTAPMAAYRLPSLDPSNLEIGHIWIWAKAVKVDGKFSMIKNQETLRRTSSKYRIVIPNREEWEKN